MLVAPSDSDHTNHQILKGQRVSKAYFNKIGKHYVILRHMSPPGVFMLASVGSAPIYFCSWQIASGSALSANALTQGRTDGTEYPLQS